MRPNHHRDEKSHGLSRFLRALTLVFCVLATGVVLGAAFLIYVPGERWWPTTIVLFGPTWLLHLVLAGAGLSWALFHRGIVLAVLLAVSELVLTMPVLGYQPPWPRADKAPVAPPLRVVTWNVGGHYLNHADVSRLFADHRADIVVLQECRGLPSDALPPPYADLHTHESHSMCMLSRLPLAGVEERDRTDVWQAAGSGAIVRFTFEDGAGPFTVTNVHLETPREGFEAFIDEGIGSGVSTLSGKNAQRYTEARLAREWTERPPALPRLVAGDFNTPPQSDVLRETWSEYQNCFGVAGRGFGHTKKTRWLGVRIDHVLASHEWICSSTEVLSGFDSDHRPVLAVVGRASH